MSAKQPRPWQRMLSGRRLNLLEPSAIDIEIEDIAHGLARVARWNGQTTGDHVYSVAQHSLLVLAIAEYLEPERTIAEKHMALLHDAPEYVIGDLISPFKALIGEQYKKIENALQEAVHLRFSLPMQANPSTQKWIKSADKASAYLEARTLAGFTLDEADKLFVKVPLPKDKFTSYLEPWPTQKVEQEFLKAHNALSQSAQTGT